MNDQGLLPCGNCKSDRVAANNRGVTCYSCFRYTPLMTVNEEYMESQRKVAALWNANRKGERGSYDGRENA